MKNALIFTLLYPLFLLLFSCHKEDPPTPTPQPHYAQLIEGKWEDMTGTFAPDWHYDFNDGLLTQHYLKTGSPIIKLSFPYAVRDSAIIIGGDATNPPREWRLLFECEDVVQVVQQGPALGQRFWLKRE